VRSGIRIESSSPKISARCATR